MSISYDFGARLTLSLTTGGTHPRHSPRRRFLMRLRWLAALTVTLLACGRASAHPNAGPTTEVRLRSVNDLVDKFEYVAGLAGKEDAVKQVRELIKVLSADGKGIEGIDPKKPMGAYAVLTKEVESSPFVIMLPVADEAQ